MKGCRPLTDREVLGILRVLRGRYAARDRALVLLGIKSGFRISELLSLRLGDVVQHGDVVKRVTVRRRNMKGKISGRTVLPPDLGGTATTEQATDAMCEALVTSNT